MLNKIKPLVTRVREIGINGDVYMRRYYTHWDAVRFHEIVRSDNDRDLHDHPWDFTSTILEGEYREHCPWSENVEQMHKKTWSKLYKAGDVLVRKATDLHRLEVVSGPVWTMVIVGPTIRKWGYQTADGWVPWDEYLKVPVCPGCKAGVRHWSPECNKGNP